MSKSTVLRFRFYCVNELESRLFSLQTDSRNLCQDFTFRKRLIPLIFRVIWLNAG